MNQEATQKSRGRIMAIFMAGAVLISLMFLLFAFIEKREADELRQTAVVYARLAQSQRQLAEENFQLAENQRQLAEEVRMELEKARLDLQACKKK